VAGRRPHAQRSAVLLDVGVVDLEGSGLGELVSGAVGGAGLCQVILLAASG